MIQSMTGFASRALSVMIGQEKAHISIQLKTLNARHLETNYRLPHQLFPLEAELLRLFKEQLYRGNIYFFIHIDNQNIFKGQVIPAFNTIEHYLNAINDIRTKFHLQEQISLAHILNLPNIFTVEEKSNDGLMETIMHEIKQLIQTVVDERTREGKHLKKDLLGRIAQMQQQISIIEQRSVALIDEQKAKIKETIIELSSAAASTPSAELLEARHQALFSVLEKIAIHEEVVRFKSHIENLLTVIKAPFAEKGKRIDFTLQEMAREINTIGAKSLDDTISAQVINIKVELEKAREQTQNIV